MGTEIFTFGPLEPEKMGFKDSNPTFEIMTKTTLLRSKFFLPYWVIDFSYTILCIILQFGHLKAWQKMNNLEQSTIIYIWKRSKWQQIIWMSICGVQTQKQGLPVKFLSLHLPLQQIQYWNLYWWCQLFIDFTQENTGWSTSQYGKKN